MMKNFNDYSAALSAASASVDPRSVEEAYLLARACRYLYIFGNGGSAAIANHWVCDFTKGINEDTFRRATAVSLSCNAPLMTAIANDIGYEHVFSRQLEYMRPSADVVFAVSSSGNSKNILRAIETAKKIGIHVVALTGFTGGEAAKMADTSVHVSSYNYGVVEDVHMSILHYISQRIRYECAVDPKTIRL